MNAATPPAFCASATTCKATVVLPEDSGPYTSIILPLGSPPTPRAASRAVSYTHLLQSANNDTLKKIGRIHTYEKFLSSYELCKSAGFDNINVDLMFSLPNETLNDFIDSLEEVIMISPSHISTYSLILEEGTKLYDNYRKNNIIIDDTLDRKMYHYCINKLKEYDYEQYEISNRCV